LALGTDQLLLDPRVRDPRHELDGLRDLSMKKGRLSTVPTGTGTS
jgi:hypothetical protein